MYESAVHDVIYSHKPNAKRCQLERSYPKEENGSANWRKDSSSAPKILTKGGRGTLLIVSVSGGREAHPGRIILGEEKDVVGPRIGMHGRVQFMTKGQHLATLFTFPALPTLGPLL
jgi:hypothetical protein